MKMENEIRAPHAGTVTSIAVEVGDRVELGSVLAVVG
jgi:biotin carboxyl carrier protein